MTKRYAKSFYFASLFLSKEKRRASYAVYALCRLSDDAVDLSAKTDAPGKLALISERIDLAFGDTELTDPLLAAFRKTVRDFRIPKSYFLELLDGMRMDLNKSRYHDFSDLYRYCYKVAGVVGLIMLEILGYTREEAKAYAVNLGIGFQLTNILRDIAEDARRARIYLPQDVMAVFKVTDSDIFKNRLTPELKELIRSEIKRARQFYLDARPGAAMLKTKRCRFVVMAMAKIYSKILNSIEKNNFDVFSKRAHVSLPGKIGCLLSILFKGEFL